MKPLLLRKPSMLLVLVAATVTAAHAWIVFVAGLVLGVCLIVGLAVARRLVQRVDHALPDVTRRPCPTCGYAVTGRRKYCSDTCQEVAAERRMRQRVHAERMADYGDVPF